MSAPRRTCAGKPDGSPCQALARQGSDYCRHHNGDQGPKQRRPEPTQTQIRAWVERFVDELRTMARNKGHKIPALEGEFGPDEPALTWNDRRFPAAAIVVFGATGIEVQLGRLGEPREVPAASVQRADLRDKGTGKKAPHMGYGFAGSSVILTVHPSVPRDADGLPDLRTFALPPDQWPALDVGSDDPHPARSLPLVDAPNHQADRDFQLAITSPNWSLNKDEAMLFWQGKKTTVIYQPPEIVSGNWLELIDHTLVSLDRRFQSMRGDLTADVIDILFLHWIANGRPNKARITLSQVIGYRGVACTPESLGLHWRAVRDARAFRLRDEYLDAAILEIDALRLRQPTLFGMEDAPASDHVLVYSPGYFVGRAVAHDPFLSHYTPNILKLEPHYFRIAKRMARHLRAEWRLNPEGYLPGGPRRYRTWEEHMASAGIVIEERYEKRQSEFLDLLDRQLTELQSIGGMREWVSGLHHGRAMSDQEWEHQSRLYHPQDRKLLRSLPYRGKLAVWQTLRIHLPPPAALDERMRQYAAGRAAREAQRQSIQREAAVRKELKAGQASKKDG